VRNNNYLFEKDFEVRYEDIDLNCKCKITSILKYLQEIAIMHGEGLGNGVLDLAEKKIAWVLMEWDVQIYKYPSYKSKVNIKTWTNGIEGLYSYRQFELFDERENVIAVATAKWILMDIEKRRPMRIPEELIDVYGYDERKLLPNSNIKLQDTENVDSSFEYKVQKRDIDTNGHVNNVNQVEFILEGLPDGIVIKNMKVVYKNEIKHGEILQISTTKINENEYVSTIKSNKTNCIIKIS